MKVFIGAVEDTGHIAEGSIERSYFVACLTFIAFKGKVPLGIRVEEILIDGFNFQGTLKHACVGRI